MTSEGERFVCVVLPGETGFGGSEKFVGREGRLIFMWRGSWRMR